MGTVVNGVGEGKDLMALCGPATPVELAVVTSFLRSEGIPYFVHNGNFGALYPGPVIPL